MKKIFLPLLTAALISTSMPCYAMTVFDPTNYAANLETKVQMIQQVINSAQQIQMQIQNLSKLDPKDLDKVEKQCTNLYASMDAIKKQSDAIGEDWQLTYQQWNEINPDYWFGGKLSLKDHGVIQEKQHERWNKTLEQALTMAGITSSGETKKTIQNVLEAIQASNNADGTVKALQAASQLNGIQIAEMQKLEALTAEMLKVITLKQQQEMDKNNEANKYAEDFMGDTKAAGNRDVTIRNKGENVDDVKIK